MIVPEQLSLLFLHFSKVVKKFGGKQTVEFIIERRAEDGNTEETFFDAAVDYECSEFETLQFVIAKVTKLLHTYPTANFVELYCSSTKMIYKGETFNGDFTEDVNTIDDEFNDEDDDLATDDDPEEQSEEKEIEEEEVSNCGFECDNGNCEHPGSHLCLQCDNYQKCPACTKYPCEKLLKEEKENEARAEAALQDDMEEEGNTWKDKNVREIKGHEAESIFSQLKITKCKHCNADLPHVIQTYDHAEGWNVNGFDTKQWLYITCPKCHNGWSLWKLGYFQESEKPEIEIVGDESKSRTFQKLFGGYLNARA